MIFQFVRLLSQNYQGLPALDAAPVFDYPRSTSSSVDLNSYGEIPMPEVANLYSLRETAPSLHPERVKPVRVDIRMTGAQIKQLHASTQAELRETDTDMYLSRQDVLAAVLVYCLSHAEPDLPPIQHIANIINVCGSYSDVA